MLLTPCGARPARRGRTAVAAAAAAAATSAGLQPLSGYMAGEHKHREKRLTRASVIQQCVCMGAGWACWSWGLSVVGRGAAAARVEYRKEGTVVNVGFALVYRSPFAASKPSEQSQWERCEQGHLGTATAGGGQQGTGDSIGDRTFGRWGRTAELKMFQQRRGERRGEEPVRGSCPLHGGLLHRGLLGWLGHKHKRPSAAATEQQGSLDKSGAAGRARRGQRALLRPRAMDSHEE